MIMRSQSLFSLGQVVATPGALDALARSEEYPEPFLYRHVSGDFGTMPEEDVEQNNWSITHGERIMSAYDLRSGETIWIITERDRSVTTLLLPSEY